MYAWYTLSSWKLMALLVSVWFMFGLMSLTPVTQKYEKASQQWLASSAIMKRDINGTYSLSATTMSCFDKTPNECLLDACVMAGEPDPNKYLIATQPNNEVCHTEASKKSGDWYNFGLTMGVNTGIVILSLFNHMNVKNWRKDRILLVCYLIYLLGHIAALLMVLDSFLIKAFTLSDFVFFAAVITTYYAIIIVFSIIDVGFVAREVVKAEKISATYVVVRTDVTSSP